MSFTNFEEMVSTLSKPARDVMPTLTEEKLDCLHAACGMSGEFGELTLASMTINIDQEPTDLLVELGDTMFYLQLMKNTLGISGEPSPSQDHLNMIPLMNKVHIRIGEIMDDVKKAVFYDRPLDEKFLSEHLANLECEMSGIAQALGSTLDDVKKMNMEKLSERYPEGKFTKEQALNRNDTEEF